MKVGSDANLHADEAVVFSENILQIAGPADSPR
jgi:hypothetical protein